MKKTVLRLVMMLACVMSLGLKPAPAHAMYVSAGDLARKCLSDKKQDIYACTNYIAGVIDYHMLMSSLGTAPTIGFCMPENVSMQQAAVIVMAYMRTAPQNDNFVAAAAVPLALNKAFPCPPPSAARHKKK